jgi:hypothetical protein
MVDEIKRERNKIQNFIPKNYEEIPLLLQKNPSKFRFLSWKYKCNRRKSFNFFSDFAKNIAMKTNVFLVEGTFRTVPVQYYQLITVHAFIFGRIVPIVFALCTSKTENMYILFLLF